MTFAAETKNELCRARVNRNCCALAESYGALLYCNTFSQNEIRLMTENEDFARRLPLLFQKAFGIRFDREPQTDKQGKMVFSVTDKDKIDRIMDAIGYDRRQSLAMHVNLALLEEEHCRVAFLRGAFLAGGSLTDPQKSYHLELAATHLRASREVETLLREMKMNPKSIRRSAYYVIYFKQSDEIEDFLTMIGAPLAAMNMMNVKLEKDLHNQVNRKLNCDAANIDKSVEAARRQVREILLLQERGGCWEELPERLRETAELRLRFPELPLSELAGKFSPPITKSCLNHRLRKLSGYVKTGGDQNE